MHEIKEHDWFKQDYTPVGPIEEDEEDEEDCAHAADEVSCVHETV